MFAYVWYEREKLKIISGIHAEKLKRDNGHFKRIMFLMEHVIKPDSLNLSDKEG